MSIAIPSTSNLADVMASSDFDPYAATEVPAENRLDVTTTAAAPPAAPHAAASAAAVAENVAAIMASSDFDPYAATDVPAENRFDVTITAAAPPAAPLAAPSAAAPSAAVSEAARAAIMQRNENERGYYQMVRDPARMERIVDQLRALNLSVDLYQGGLPGSSSGEQGVVVGITSFGLRADQPARTGQQLLTFVRERIPELRSQPARLDISYRGGIGGPLPSTVRRDVVCLGFNTR